MRWNWSIKFKDHSCWFLKVLSGTKKLGFDGIKETQCTFNLRTIYSVKMQMYGEMRWNWSIEFNDNSCWFFKVLSRTKKLGFDGIKETQCAFSLRTIYSNWKAIVWTNEVKLKHWVQRSFLVLLKVLSRTKKLGFDGINETQCTCNLRTIYTS